MKILFVCCGNAYRSPVAEALLKKFRPDIDVDSAGTHAVIPISDEAKKYLTRENAVDHLKKKPESLDEKRLDEYDVIVAMKQEHKNLILSQCPECESKIIVWNIDDPYFMPRGYAEKTFRQIREKVLQLANSL